MSSTRTRQTGSPIGFASERGGVPTDVAHDPRGRRPRRAISREAHVARRVGLHPERDLAQACSDFYLLTYLRRPHYVVPAADVLGDLVNDLASEFAHYLDMACGGELRHASTWPQDLSDCPILGTGIDRSVAWREWLAWETPISRARYAMSAFEEASWPGRNYGGEPWVLIAATLHQFLTMKLRPELFLDRVWNLQHHGGIVLNKIYNVDELSVVLDAHGKDDHETLLSFASQRTKELWSRTFTPRTKTVEEVRASLRLWVRLALQPVVS